jgi:hypothetical protein
MYASKPAAEPNKPTSTTSSSTQQSPTFIGSTCQTPIDLCNSCDVDETTSSTLQPRGIMATKRKLAVLTQSPGDTSCEDKATDRASLSSSKKTPTETHKPHKPSVPLTSSFASAPIRSLTGTFKSVNAKTGPPTDIRQRLMDSRKPAARPASTTNLFTHGRLNSVVDLCDSSSEDESPPAATPPTKYSMRLMDAFLKPAPCSSPTSISSSSSSALPYPTDKNGTAAAAAHATAMRKPAPSSPLPTVASSSPWRMRSPVQVQQFGSYNATAAYGNRQQPTNSKKPEAKPAESMNTTSRILNSFDMDLMNGSSGNETTPTANPIKDFVIPTNANAKPAPAINSSASPLQQQSIDQYCTPCGPTSTNATTVRNSPLSSQLPRNDEQLYSLQEFTAMLQSAVVSAGEEDLLDLEDSSLVRSANSKISKEETSYQERAQYGRLLEAACDDLLRKILCIQPNETFVDIGHGIGTLVLQAAYTIGCDARGIELVEDRNVLACAFALDLEHQRLNLHQIRDGRNMQAGSVTFRRDELQNPNVRNFLTRDGDRVIKALCNNFNGVFADKSAKNVHTYYLDDFVAGLFATMKEGSQLATMHPLTMTVPPLKQAQSTREKQNMAHVEQASFYTMNVVSLGPQNLVASWSYGGGCKKVVKVYVYTRVGPSTFCCCDPRCLKARDGIQLDATKQVNISGVEYHVLNSCCSQRSTRSTQGIHSVL